MMLGTISSWQLSVSLMLASIAYLLVSSIGLLSLPMFGFLGLLLLHGLLDVTLDQEGSGSVLRVHLEVSFRVLISSFTISVISFTELISFSATFSWLSS